MGKPGSSLPRTGGLAEWLPLLGSICQVLAALGEEDRDEDNLVNPADVQPGTASPKAG